MAGDNKGAKGAEIVDAKVARRRTVRVGSKHFGPGETVSLPAAEVEALRERGFLDKPDAKPVAEGNGPRFTQQGGPTTEPQE